MVSIKLIDSLISYEAHLPKHQTIPIMQFSSDLGLFIHYDGGLLLTLCKKKKMYIDKKQTVHGKNAD